MSKGKLAWQLLLLPLGIYLGVLFFPILTTQGEVQPTPGQVLGLVNSRHQSNQSLARVQKEQFGLLNQVGPPLSVKPVNRTGAIIIEKINVNSPIAWNTSVVNPKEYKKALDKGVAHAKGTARPKDPSDMAITHNSNSQNNTYLFAHSVANEAWIERYNAVFTKLDELVQGDRIVIFEDNKRYDYEVEKIAVVPPTDTTIFTRSFDRPTLTLQTCFPRGVLKDRLVATAKLVGVYTR